jgi:hypothetical protein
MIQRRLFRHWRGAVDVFVANSRATAGRLAEEDIGPVEVSVNGTSPRLRRPPLDGPPVLAYAGGCRPRRAWTGCSRRSPVQKIQQPG